MDEQWRWRTNPYIRQGKQQSSHVTAHRSQRRHRSGQDGSYPYYQSDRMPPHDEHVRTWTAPYSYKQTHLHQHRPVYVQKTPNSNREYGYHEARRSNSHTAVHEAPLTSQRNSKTRVPDVREQEGRHFVKHSVHDQEHHHHQQEHLIQCRLNEISQSQGMSGGGVHQQPQSDEEKRQREGCRVNVEAPHH